MGLPYNYTYPEADYQDALNTAQCKRLDDRRQELCYKTLRRSNNLILVLITFYLLFVQRCTTGS
jgi:hypothetical protein